MVLNSAFRYVDGWLHVDAISLETIASEVDSPVYVYSLRRVLENYRRLQHKFTPVSARLHYSVKANGNSEI
ncbi:MAG: hypothetical protein F4243_08485 [Chloroflexi bacterium]|nr:hypothetical protein [Chloroflexota bacterium]